MRWLVVLALVACTHHPKPDTRDQGHVDETPVKKPPPADAALAPDAAVAPDAAPPACPAAFKGLGGTSCTSDEQECSYPEGACRCENDMPCTGSVKTWQYAKDHPTLKWLCVVKTRPDGCPGVEPGQGTACTKEGKVCEYAQCISATMSCHGGKWQLDKRGEPPP